VQVTSFMDLTVVTHPGPIELTLAFGATFTISFLSERVKPYIKATSIVAKSMIP
jgi:hypothetical protein